MQDNRKLNQRSGSSLAEGCCSLLIFLTFLILFGIYTGDASYYAPCSKKSSTYDWSHFAFISMIVCFALQGVLLTIIIICSLAKSVGALLCSGVLLLIARLTSGILNFVVYIGLIHAYKNEECGSLTNLALGYIIIMSIGLGFLACACCILCIGGAVAGGTLGLGLLSTGNVQASNEYELMTRHNP